MTGPIWSAPLKPGRGTAAATAATGAGVGAAAGAAWAKLKVGAMAAASNRQKRGKAARRAQGDIIGLITWIRGTSWITPNEENSSTKNPF
jgi:hypothetical protein